MIQTRSQVKATIFLFLIVTLLGCQHTPPSPSTLVLSSQGREPGLLQPGTWLGLPLKLAPYAELREQILTDSTFWQLSSMKNRGEAHITLLTPPEYQSLKDEVGETRLLSVLAQIPWTEAKWSAVCVGEARLSMEHRSFFVVVESPELFGLRQELWEKLGRPAGFQPKFYEPHITLGFTERDLHRADGIRKDSSSCKAPVLLKEGLSSP